MTAKGEPGGRSVLVTGGTGAVGPALVARLRAAGLRVRVLSRGRTPGPWPEGTVDMAQGDVSDRAVVRSAVQGASWVFHLAALLHQAEGSPELGPVFERVNAVGASIVAEECVRAGVERLVLFSTIAVYGPTASAGADEETEPSPRTAYALSKLRGERFVLEYQDRGPMTVTILRLAAVYGARLKGNYCRLVRAIESGWFFPVGTGLNRRTLVHEADVAEAAMLAASSPRAAGRVYNVSDGNIYGLRDVISAIHSALGRRQGRFHIPLGPVRAMAGLADAALRAAQRPPRLVPLLEKYTEDVAVRADRIQRELGFRPRFGLQAGWRDVLRSGDSSTGRL